MKVIAFCIIEVIIAAPEKCKTFGFNTRKTRYNTILEKASSWCCSGIQEIERSKYMHLLCIYTNYAFEYIKHIQLLRNAQLVKETHHVSSYTYPAKFPLAMILSAVYVVSLIQPYTHST